MFSKKRREYKNIKAVRIELEEYIHEKNKHDISHYSKLKDVLLVSEKQKMENSDFWLSEKIKNEQFNIAALSVSFEKEYSEFMETINNVILKHTRDGKLNNLIEEK